MTYTGLQGRVHRMLQNVSWTRERRMKDRALVKLLTKSKFDENPETATFSLTELTDLVQDYTTADRYWRQLTDRHPELRGADFDDKKIYAQKKQIELGYEAGYHRDVKKLAEITA